MATKYVCDCCGNEIKKHPLSFEYLMHLDPTERAVPGYCIVGENDEWIPVSGRSIECDLCNRCYNDVVAAAVDRMFELKAKYESKQIT